ncbi:MAG: Tn3 family transposase [Actinomycetota bacterium]|nr:Tn3 family transposase [Actinomycetota bacterium]
MINGIFSARSTEIWGEATTACASDSKKFGAWDQNLLTSWSIRHRANLARNRWVSITLDTDGEFSRAAAY